MNVMSLVDTCAETEQPLPDIPASLADDIETFMTCASSLLDIHEAIQGCANADAVDEGADAIYDEEADAFEDEDEYYDD